MPVQDIINPLAEGTLLHGTAYDYVIRRVLGQGSFGITYLATVRMCGQLGSIDTDMRVAIKEFFPKDHCGREASTVTSSGSSGLFDYYKRKFVSEAHNLSRLQHPHIIKVVECFEANNTVYYSMEYLGGGSLDDLIARRGHLSDDEALALARQIADALAFMHSQRTLHLDLKPGNVMMSTPTELKLIDFGLTKKFDAQGKPESSTRIGAGTPGYAPVEQANWQGPADTLSPSNSGGNNSSSNSNSGATKGGKLPVTLDIYALGATLYKMLTGSRPPEASDVLNDGLPPRPAHVAPATWAAVAAAMQPIRKNRPQSVAAWLALLPTPTPAEAEVLATNYRPTRPLPPTPTPSSLSLAQQRPRQAANRPMVHTPAGLQPASPRPEKKNTDKKKPSLLTFSLLSAVAAVLVAAIFTLKKCTSDPEQPEPQPQQTEQQTEQAIPQQSDPTPTPQAPNRRPPKRQQLQQQPQQPQVQVSSQVTPIQEPQALSPAQQTTPDKAQNDSEVNFSPLSQCPRSDF